MKRFNFYCRKQMFFILTFLLVAFSYENAFCEQSQKPDYWPTKGWRTATPESQGMDSQKLVDMMDLIWEGEYSIDSLLIIRNGYLVLEVYGYPYNKDTTHNLFSCSKSVTSALIGIAIDKGYIKGVNQPLLDFFPDLVAANLDADKKAITLEHVLTMTTGLQCQDSYLYNRKGLWRMRMSDDWVKFMLDLPLAEKPGTHFEYCNGATFLLSAILQKQTGMPALSFAVKYLFNPLGITKTDWTSNPDGINLGYRGLHMLPNDMAKIGYLYLNDGLWEGKEILSSKWIKASTQKYVSVTSADGYGYQWLIIDPNTYAAIGGGGQLISVVKNKNLVVVFTGSNDLNDTTAFAMPELVKLFISPAVKSSAPLPENPQAVEALKSLTEKYQSKIKNKRVSQ